MSSVLLLVSGSQVKRRKPIMSFDTYSGSHETVSDDCSLETPITSRNKNGELPPKVSFGPNWEFVWLHNQPGSWSSAVVGTTFWSIAYLLSFPRYAEIFVDEVRKKTTYPVLQTLTGPI